MRRIDILEELGKKETKAADIAYKVVKNPDLLPELFDGISSATARTRCMHAAIVLILQYHIGLMQLFRYYNMGITLRAGSPVSQTVITTKDFILQPEHVRAMFHVAKDLRSKLLISMGNDLGWRISDIIKN